jgi:hypothetical protein
MNHWLHLAKCHQSVLQENTVCVVCFWESNPQLAHTRKVLYHWATPKPKTVFLTTIPDHPSFLEPICVQELKFWCYSLMSYSSYSYSYPDTIRIETNKLSEVGHTCDPSFMGSIGRRITVWIQPQVKTWELTQKINWSKRWLGAWLKW